MSTASMQYSKPSEPNRFFGDAMPFFHDGVFHLVILIDEGHHAAFGGLGGHRWAHYTSTDLKAWIEHPLILAPGKAGMWDCYGICTGSLFFHDGIYYAFYAARVATAPGWDHFITEKVGIAHSEDCIHFVKEPSPILAPAAGYAKDYRDPFVFQDGGTGLFHLLISARLSTGKQAGPEGCLAHFSSADLKTWSPLGPFGRLFFNDTPECPDHFEWNGWYYLIASQGGVGTYYMSKNPLGPWTRPEVNSFEPPMAVVMRTAAWKGNRRLGVAFLRSRKQNRNAGDWLYAGNAVFRELVQEKDGTLGVRFVPEMMPTTGERLPLNFVSATGEILTDCSAELTANTHVAVRQVPLDARINFTVRFDALSPGFSLFLRADEQGDGGAEMRWDHQQMRGDLHPGALSKTADPESWHNLVHLAATTNGEHHIEILLYEDVIDVCIDDCRCVINRLPESRGTNLFFRSGAGAVAVSDFSIHAISI